MYAVVETSGRQFRVEPGRRIEVGRLSAEVGSLIELDRVLLVAAEGEIRIGAPLVEGARVTAEVQRHALGRKQVVFKKKRRKNYRRNVGHRQPCTVLEIKEIVS